MKKLSSSVSAVLLITSISAAIILALPIGLFISQKNNSHGTHSLEGFFEETLKTDKYVAVASGNNLTEVNVHVTNHSNNPGRASVYIADDHGEMYGHTKFIDAGDTKSFNVPFDLGEYSIMAQAADEVGNYLFYISDKDI